MTKLVWRSVVVLGCSAVLLTGCRKPVLDTGYRVQHAPVPRRGGDVLDMPLVKAVDLPDVDGWKDNKDTLVTPEGGRGTI
ncbi:MAG: hypothetical protein HON70_14580, partial [Lentisphaerae bacterium]|nr:hypothetical protein [Lentisphaerota bacterium]